MNAEIIGIGSELLLGQIVNSDAQFLSQQLSYLGINVYWHTAVEITPAEFWEVFVCIRTLRYNYNNRWSVATMDDLSKETVAEFLGLKLEVHQPSLNRIQNTLKH